MSKTLDFAAPDFDHLNFTDIKDEEIKSIRAEREASEIWVGISNLQNEIPRKDQEPERINVDAENV